MERMGSGGGWMCGGAGAERQVLRRILYHFLCLSSLRIPYAAPLPPTGPGPMKRRQSDTLCCFGPIYLSGRSPGPQQPKQVGAPDPMRRSTISREFGKYGNESVSAFVVWTGVRICGSTKRWGGFGQQVQDPRSAQAEEVNENQEVGREEEKESRARQVVPAGSPARTE